MLAQPDLMRRSHMRDLRDLEQPPQAVPAEPEPAVPVRRSVGKDHLICLVCGQKQNTLKRDLAVRHELSSADYRRALRPELGLPAGRAELCGAAFRAGSADRVGAEACPGRASCNGADARGNRAEGTKASHSLQLRIPSVAACFAVHRKNMEYSGWGSSWRRGRGR